MICGARFSALLSRTRVVTGHSHAAAGVYDGLVGGGCTKDSLVECARCKDGRCVLVRENEFRYIVGVTGR
jgi:hypothetical protein